MNKKKFITKKTFLLDYERGISGDKKAGRKFKKLMFRIAKKKMYKYFDKNEE